MGFFIYHCLNTQSNYPRDLLAESYLTDFLLWLAYTKRQSHKVIPRSLRQEKTPPLLSMSRDNLCAS